MLSDEAWEKVGNERVERERQRSRVETDLEHFHAPRRHLHALSMVRRRASLALKHRMLLRLPTHARERLQRSSKRRLRRLSSLSSRVRLAVVRRRSRYRRRRLDLD